MIYILEICKYQQIFAVFIFNNQIFYIIKLKLKHQQNFILTTYIFQTS